MTLIDDLSNYAMGQGGAISTRQAARLGATPNDLVIFVRERSLLHPFRGAYLVPGPDDETPEAAHGRLCRAALLVYPRGVLGGVSAVVAHDLPATGSDLSRPVVHHGSHRGVGIRGVRVRRTRPQDAVETLTGPALPVAEAVVDHARDHGTLAGVIAGDAALHRGLSSVGDLESALERVRTWPRAARAAACLTFLDGRSESPGESWTRFDLAVAGIEVVPQVEIHDRFGELVARVDMVVKGTKTIIEFDGRLKYSSGDVLWAEKKREDRLRRLGYTIVRVTWADLHQPGRVAALVRQAMAA